MSKSKAMTNLQRQHKFRRNMQEQGFALVQVWIPAEDREAFIELSRELRQKGFISSSSLINWQEELPF